MLLNANLFNARVVTSAGGVDIYCSGIQAGVWNYVAMTYDGSTLKGYVNGVLSASAAQTGNISYGSSLPMRIGICNGASYYFNGHMDEFKFYDGPLAATAIQQDYNTAYPLVTAPPQCGANITPALLTDPSFNRDSTAPQYTFWPNAAGNEITIKPVSIATPVLSGGTLQVQWYNAVGHLVKSATIDISGQTINVSGLQAGLYFVRLVGQAGVITTKVIIAR